MKRLSLVMIVKDEERCLQRCLESAKDLVDEIVIVDTGSSDCTKEIAASFTTKVFEFKWTNDFASARNFALDKSTGDWNLILDADEYIVNGSREVFESFFLNNAIGRVKIIHSFRGDKGIIQYSREFTSRIAPNFVRYTGKIHEQMETNLSRKNINIEIHHDGFLYQDKSERNLTILYHELQDKPNDSYVLYQIAHTLSVAGRHNEAEGYYKKFYNYVDVHDSFRLNGIVDYLYNCIALKHFEEGLMIINKETLISSNSADFHFVTAVLYMDLILSDVKRYIDYLPCIEQEYLLCLQIGENGQGNGVVGTGSFGAAYNLGVWYEVSGSIEKAKKFYEMSADLGYELAVMRLNSISNK